MHKNNILHRGLNLKNTLIDRNAQIKISDLFLSKIMDCNDENKELVGIPSVTAPEILMS